MKILLIEDNEASAKGLCRLLHQRMDNSETGTFVECRIVNTLADGIRVSHEFQADVATLDLILPGSSTEEVLESIKLIYQPVVVVSDLIEDDFDLLAKCWDYGAKGVLSKRGLLEKITTIDGIIQKVRFMDAITGSHLRNRATARVELVTSNGQVSD